MQEQCSCRLLCANFVNRQPHAGEALGSLTASGTLSFPPTATDPGTGPVASGRTLQPRSERQVCDYPSDSTIDWQFGGIPVLDSETEDGDRGRIMKRVRRRIFMITWTGLPDIFSFPAKKLGYRARWVRSNAQDLSTAAFLTPVFKLRRAAPGSGMVPRFYPLLGDFQPEPRRVRRRYITVTAASTCRGLALPPRAGFPGSDPEPVFRYRRLGHRHGEVLSERGIGPAVRNCYESCRFGDCVNLQRFG